MLPTLHVRDVEVKDILVSTVSVKLLEELMLV
jgi:hypothetical protein